MGFQTTFTISNDRIQEFLDDPVLLADTLQSGMNQANMGNKRCFLEGGYVCVQPSRHADDNTLFLHWGNTVTNIHGYSNDFQGIMKNNPEQAIKMIKIAEDLLKMTKRKLNARLAEI